MLPIIKAISTASGAITLLQLPPLFKKLLGSSVEESCSILRIFTKRDKKIITFLIYFSFAEIKTFKCILKIEL